MNAALELFRSAIQRGEHPSDALGKLFVSAERFVADNCEPVIAKMDCKKGCSFCCRLTVAATPVEVFAVQRYVERTFSEADRASLNAALDLHSQRVAGRHAMELDRENRACPFLRDGSCSVYSVRPFSCRRFHSVRVSDCERAATDPNYDERRYSPDYEQVWNDIRDLVTATLDTLGMDTKQQELGCASRLALLNQKCGKRWRQGKAPMIHNSSSPQLYPR